MNAPIALKPVRPWRCGYVSRISGATVLLIALCAVVGGASVSVAADDRKVVEMNPADFEKALEGKTVIEFTLLPSGTLVAKDGTMVEIKDLPRHLRQTRAPKDAFYQFWVIQPEQIEIVRTAIARCTAYGASNFAVRMISADEREKSAAPDSASVLASAGKRIAVMVPGANPEAHLASDTPPSFEGRPAHLKPAPLPRRVRCRFAADEQVVAAADSSRRLFLESTPIDASLLDDSMIVQPGAWKHVRKLSGLADSQAATSSAQTGSRIVNLEMRILRTQSQVELVVKRVRELIAKDGGGAIRTMTSEEMDYWWTFIAFDIEEPVFVIETKKGRYRFIVGFDREGKLNLIDELNALPRV